MFSKKVAEQDDTKHELSQTQKMSNVYSLEADNFKDYHNKYMREANLSSELNQKVTQVNAHLEAKAK